MCPGRPRLRWRRSHRLTRSRTAWIVVVLALGASTMGGLWAADRTGGSPGPPPTLTVRGSVYGNIVVGPGGRAVYMYVDDSTDPPRSDCVGGCLADWPLLPAPDHVRIGSGITGRTGVFTRPDGALQLTLNGYPLYYFAGDERRGDTRGEGLAGVWYLLTPAGSPIAFVSSTFDIPYPVIPTTLGTGPSRLGTVVVDSEDQTVYTYAKEPADAQACEALWCTQDWSALAAHGPATSSPTVTGPVGTVRRPDGTVQVTLAGHPLYTFAGDLAVGDVRGQGIGGDWFALRPDGQMVAASS